METAMSTINLLPSTGDQISRFVALVRDEILSGECDPLHALVQLRAAQKAIEILNKDAEILEAAMKQYDKYGQKTADLTAATVTVKETGVRYEYDDCGDVEYSRICEAESLVTAKRKEREKFLQSVKERTTLIDEKSGEVYTVNPPAKKSTTSPVVTLK